MICHLSGIEGFGFVRIKFFSSPLHKVMLYSYPSLLAFEWQSIFYSPPLHSVSDDWSFLRPPWKPWISPEKSSNRPPLPPLHIYPPLPSREKSWLVLYLIVTAIYSPNETDWQTPICYFILKLFWLAVEGKLVLTLISLHDWIKSYPESGKADSTYSSLYLIVP